LTRPQQTGAVALLGFISAALNNQFALAMGFYKTAW
jgi:hypothetical protein